MYHRVVQTHKHSYRETLAEPHHRANNNALVASKYAAWRTGLALTIYLLLPDTQLVSISAPEGAQPEA
ncbi:hypothetical protein BST61_g179 [Cercospora zeina]